MGMDNTWKKFTNFLNHPIVQLLGGSTVIAMITWIITHIAKLPLWQIWLATLFGIGCAFWIINQIGIWRKRHRKKLSKLSDKELEETIYKWLAIPGFAITRQSTKEPEIFHLSLSLPKNGINVDIVKSKLYSDMVFVMSRIIYSERHLSQQELNRVRSKIDIEMARLGVEFIPPPETVSQQAQIIVQVAIPITDELTAFEFRQTTTLIARALLLVKLVSDETLPPNVTQPTSHKGGSRN
jgi:hypothetical protein